MSHDKLRDSKICLNCDHFVKDTYCPNCGQKNIESRQPAIHLFTHFLEDFTHYDGQFWKTIKNLLFRPGYLTKVYLSGKRQMYVPPVKLYIFVSFVTFFLSAVLPSDDIKIDTIPSKTTTKTKNNKLHEIKKDNYIQKNNSLDVINKITPEKKESTEASKSNDLVITNIDTASALEEFEKENDGIVKTIGRPFVKKFTDLQNKGLSREEISEKFSDTFMHTLPKALFIYLPIFALFMWLFHNKKKWFYYDHGIFTLHYFSFILTSIVAIILFDTIEDFVNSPIVTFLFAIYTFATIVYWFIYFFKAHKNIYQNQRSITLIKGILLFVINIVFILILLLGLLAVSFLMLH